MDDTEDDARYPPNAYGVNQQQGYGSSNRQKLSVRNSPYPRAAAGNQYMEDEVDEDEEDLGDEEEDDDEDNAVQRIDNHVNDDYGYEDEDDQKPNVFNRRTKDVELERRPKKRKLKNLVSNYEFAPRVTAPSIAAAPKGLFGGRNPLADWTEHETLILLDAWGDRFVQHGRKSLRSEEWQEVAEKVSQESKTERTDTQCRNRLDTLKKKYKKEKMKLAETESSGVPSKWVFFKKMDVLMTSSARQAGLSSGLDSGEYVSMNPKVYLNHANGLDEMRDSPGNSESTEDEGKDSDELPPKRKKLGGGNNDERSSFGLIADSIHKFSQIYEKIENSKRQQMAELEKMWMDFHRDLEMQKRQILENARTEIAKIRQGGDEENDVSTENFSG